MGTNYGKGVQFVADKKMCSFQQTETELSFEPEFCLTMPVFKTPSTATPSSSSPSTNPAPPSPPPKISEFSAMVDFTSSISIPPVLYQSTSPSTSADGVYNPVRRDSLGRFQQALDSKPSHQCRDIQRARKRKDFGSS